MVQHSYQPSPPPLPASGTLMVFPNNLCPPPRLLPAVGGTSMVFPNNLSRVFGPNLLAGTAQRFMLKPHLDGG